MVTELRVVQFWSEIIRVISNIERARSASSICTSLSSITIINQLHNSLRRFTKTYAQLLSNSNFSALNMQTFLVVFPPLGGRQRNAP